MTGRQVGRFYLITVYKRELLLGITTLRLSWYWSDSLFCAGIERLCMCTASGKLKFYQVNQQQVDAVERASQVLPASSEQVENKKGLADEDALESSPGKVPSGMVGLSRTGSLSGRVPVNIPSGMMGLLWTGSLSGRVLVKIPSGMMGLSWTGSLSGRVPVKVPSGMVRLSWTGSLSGTVPHYLSKYLQVWWDYLGQVLCLAEYLSKYLQVWWDYCGQVLCLAQYLSKYLQVWWDYLGQVLCLEQYLSKYLQVWWYYLGQVLYMAEYLSKDLQVWWDCLGQVLWQNTCQSIFRYRGTILDGYSAR